MNSGHTSLEDALISRLNAKIPFPYHGAIQFPDLSAVVVACPLMRAIWDIDNPL